MKVPIIEIKTIYRESTAESMKPRIKSMIWNMRKQKQPRKTARRKENPKR